MDVAALRQLLRETGEHPGSFEVIAPPHDWWDWYAAYVDARERRSTPEEGPRSPDATWRSQTRRPLTRTDPRTGPCAQTPPTRRGLSTASSVR
jgi:hypothetical protein